MKNDVVILAAGKGNRLKPITDVTPKTLIKIGSETILEKILNSLPKDKIGKVIIVVKHLSSLIEEYLLKNKTKFPFQIKTVYQGDKTPGTYGALWSAKNSISDWFIVLGGDDLHGKNDLNKFFVQKNLIGICKKESSYFEVLFDEQEKFVGFNRSNEKKERFIATGTYTLNKSFFDLTPELTIENEYGIPQTIEKNKDMFEIYVMKEENWNQINTHGELKSAREKYS